MKPKIGIIGKGNVGGAVKKGLDRAGYQVKMVGNDPKAVGEAAKWAEIIVLAVPFMAFDEVVREMGAAVNGKTVVDATNIYTPEAVAAVGSRSGAEVLQEKIPRANVVKGLNTHFSDNMSSGHIGNQQLTFFVAGNDNDAKAKVLQLGRDLGFDAVDAGPLANAGLLESLGNLSILLAYAQGLGRNIGFKLVRG